MLSSGRLWYKQPETAETGGSVQRHRFRAAGGNLQRTGATLTFPGTWMPFLRLAGCLGGGLSPVRRQSGRGLEVSMSAGLHSKPLTAKQTSAGCGKTHPREERLSHVGAAQTQTSGLALSGHLPQCRHQGSPDRAGIQEQQLNDEGIFFKRGEQKAFYLELSRQP